MGKITTLFEDKEQTKELFPRTKVSAIDDDKGNALSSLIMYHGNGLDSDPVPVDADLLQGHDASYFATVTDVKSLQTKTRINYLRPTLQSQTVNGVTITNNGDGTYTLNGTATDNTSFSIGQVNSSKTYKLIGCPNIGDGSCSLQAYDDSWAYFYHEFGNGIILPQINKIRYVRIYIPNGITCNNLLFKPMITDDLSATYDDFVSYNNSLATNKNIINATRINYLRPTLQTTTSNGITCTNNGDGTYTLNGTASANTKFWLFGGLPLSLESKLLIGCPKGGNDNSFKTTIVYKRNDGYISDYQYETGNGLIIPIMYPTVTDFFDLCIDISSGYTCDNLVFKPMITDDLSATYDDFVSGFDCLTPDLKMDLLWTNASPTSTFLPQTISLDLSKYKALNIIARASTVGTTYYDNLFLIDNKSKRLFLPDNYFLFRTDVALTVNGVSFGDAYYDRSIDNNGCIPYQIYGVR